MTGTEDPAPRRPRHRLLPVAVAVTATAAGVLLASWAGLVPTTATGWAVVLGIVALLVGWNALLRRTPAPRALRLALGIAPAVALLAWAVAPTFVDERVDEGLLEAVPAAMPTPAAARGGAAPPASVAPPAVAEPQRLATGALADAGGHSASGTASLYEVDGSAVVRLEDLDVENGPDVVVVLVAEPGATSPDGGVELGALKGNQGSANYVVPDGVDVSELRGVLLWCRAFSTPMAAAGLA